MEYSDFIHNIKPIACIIAIDLLPDGSYGDIKIPVLTNKQCVIQRDFDGERVLVAINADDQPYTAHFDAGYGLADDLVTGNTHDFGGGSHLPPYSSAIWKMER